MNPNSNTIGIFTEHIPLLTCPNCGAELDVSEFGVFEDINCPACQEVIKVPGRLGNFVLLEELGRGAMGCVYLAVDESLGRHVALKVMRREYGDDPKMMETLQREAQAMAALNHPNVVQVYSFGRESGQPYFVMELLQGERLDAMMEGGGIVNELRLLEIAIDVARGLEAAANAGMTHGDIKPANILMNDAGTAKVVDFGLARFTESGDEIEVWGTPYYIAPEKARKKGEDARSDQYSLGATLFHALAGHPPFDGENPTRVVLAALKEETPDLIAHNPNVCPETSAVIKRMMDKTAARRYPTYSSLVADLQVALDAARRVEEARLEAERLAEDQRKHKRSPLGLIMALVTVFIVLAIGAGVWIRQRNLRKLAELTYEGPARQLHEPILRNEDRNLREAAIALARGSLFLAGEKLDTADRLIPEIHAGKAWFRFFAAGIQLYARHPDQARELLTQASKQDPILFDGGRVPPEDPRLLARYALGEAGERELERVIPKAQPYFVHLAELARGYRALLEDNPGEAARHFRYYRDIRAQGWPYVLQPLADSFHVAREPMVSAPPPTATPFLSAPKPPPSAMRSPSPRPERADPPGEPASGTA